MQSADYEHNRTIDLINVIDEITCLLRCSRANSQHYGVAVCLSSVSGEKARKSSIQFNLNFSFSNSSHRILEIK